MLSLNPRHARTVNDVIILIFNTQTKQSSILVSQIPSSYDQEVKSVVELKLEYIN